MSTKNFINILLLIFAYIYLYMSNNLVFELKNELKRAENMTNKLLEAQNQLLDYEQKGLVKNFFPEEIEE